MVRVGQTMSQAWGGSEVECSVTPKIIWWISGFCLFWLMGYKGSSDGRTRNESKIPDNSFLLSQLQRLNGENKATMILTLKASCPFVYFPSRPIINHERYSFCQWQRYTCFFRQDISKYRLMGQVGRGFANGPRRPGFNPRSSHTNDFKMVLDTSLLNTQQYKVRIKGKVERSSAFLYTSVK